MPKSERRQTKHRNEVQASKQFYTELHKSYTGEKSHSYFPYISKQMHVNAHYATLQGNMHRGIHHWVTVVHRTCRNRSPKIVNTCHNKVRRDKTTIQHDDGRILLMTVKSCLICLLAWHDKVIVPRSCCHMVETPLQGFLPFHVDTTKTKGSLSMLQWVAPCKFSHYKPKSWANHNSEY